MLIIKIFLFALVILALLYLGALSFLFFRQKQFIFYPIPLSREYPFPELTNFEEVVLSEKGKRYWHGIYFPVENPKGCVLYLHGNTGHIGRWAEEGNIFRKLQYAVMMIDYPGYGKSRGLLTERGINRQAKMAYDWLIKKYDARDIIILGRSLGSGPATQLATKVDSKCLILETPYTSIPAVAYQHYKIFPVKKLLQYRFSTLKKIKHTRSPVFIFHGTEDEQIPFEMAEKIAAVKGKLITIPDQDHNGFVSTDLYKSTIAQILA